MKNKIHLINQVLTAYFEVNTSVHLIPAKDMMPYLIKTGVFASDSKDSLGKPLRELLRKLDTSNELHLIPFVFADRKSVNTNWYFQRKIVTTIAPKPKKETIIKNINNIEKKDASMNRDENYVLDLCDEVLNIKGLRQHKFDFLVGDSGRKLPVDIYYPKLNLVIEYRETQHINPVKHFDKPDKLTVSGVSRGEQRKIYDQRRRDVLPENGIQLIEIDYLDFTYDRKNRIIRDRKKDLEVVKKVLHKLPALNKL
ncbi:hypothetical protein [Sphingobacterium cellulitidis]|uniref:hypothetical protein n=1 Tax=Sphingobacterium cellulitidis TaxID=1768011 RepID=UPI003C7ABBE7